VLLAVASKSFLEEASREVRPVYAQGLFFVGIGAISYYLVFDYHDPLGYYEAITSDRRLLEEEAAKLSYNMQRFLDEERVVVNGVRVRPRVSMVDIGFRSSRRRPYIVFAIRFRAPVRPGSNTYENWYEPEVPEYNYVAYWIFPPGARVREVVVGEEFDVVGGNVVAIYGRRGVKTSGYEKIVFEMPELREGVHGQG